VSLFGLDQIVDRAAVAERTADAHNLRASFAAADACHIPFRDGTFDSTFCVAVLQHIREPGEALREFARVTRRGGRILAVEPDNSARYWYSSVQEGMTASTAARQFFDAIAKSRGEAPEARVGPQLTTLFANAGVEPLEMQVFPVSMSKLGPPEAKLWVARKRAVEAEISWAKDPAVRTAGDEFLHAIDAYEKAAGSAGPGFVEIQSTLLFAVVGINQQ
jgi:SAM-dependent methyltransferase